MPFECSDPLQKLEWGIFGSLDETESKKEKKGLGGNG